MKKLRGLLLAALLCLLCTVPAYAMEYSFNGADDYLFGTPTSDNTIYEWENPNVDRSKDTALIPPGFGTPTSYLPGSGEHLTPNLVPGALTGGGLVNQTGSVTYPSVDVSGGGQYSSAGTISFTDVTSNMYYSGGYLGTLKIPAIGVSTRIYEGTDNAALAKGAGHFTDTSIWAGNVCLAAHSRGTNAIFGKIHTLKTGATITLTTKLGTRTYSVVSVKKVLETDTSGTAATSGNQITLYTCVMNEREYRWCVRAMEQ